MEQLSIRDWMIIIGGMMIAGVILDAVRRYWRERRTELKLNARIERTSPGEDQSFNLLTELPNGGARIIRRGDLGEGFEADEWVDIDEAHDADRAEDVASVDSVDSPVSTDSPDPINRRDPIDVAVDAEPHGHTEVAPPAIDTGTGEDAAEKAASSVTTAESSASAAESSRRRTVKRVTTAEDPIADGEANDSGTVDWLDSIEANEPDLPEQGRLPRGANTHVFILYVVARLEEGFAGATILETLLENDLRFGDMDFFHRHERTSGRGAIEFSVANMMKPGVFDIDNMEPLQTRGLMFFVTLPGPTDMLKAFDYMYETTKRVAKSLEGDIQDETRSVITRQSLEHMRQQIRELERRLLVRRT